MGRRTGSWYSVSRRGPQGLTGVQNSQDSRFSPKAEALLKAAIQQYGNLSGELVNSVAGHLETKRRAVSRQPSDIALWFSAGATGHHVAHHAHDSIGRDDDSSIISGFLPTLIVSPFAGVWADRFDRKLLIVLADTMIALATFVLAILFLLGYGSAWLLFGASAIRSLGAGIQTPAVGAILPQFVPQEMLTKVNAINGTIQSTMTLLSPMLARRC